jgi:hypothetical protein
MPFGALVSNVQHYYYEQAFEVDLGNYGIAEGSAANFNCVDISMPWTGDVMVDLAVQLAYQPNILGAEVWPAASITPTNLWAGKKDEYSVDGGQLVCPMFAKWNNLTIGTYLMIGIQVKVTIANGGVNSIRCVGSMRAQAA